MLHDRIAPPALRIGNGRRGFNLIEAAVVLGVIGVVLGALWLGAAKFREDFKVNKTLEATLKMIDGVRTLNSGFTPNQISTRPTGNMDWKIMSSLYAAGVIPKDVYSNCILNASTNTLNYCVDGMWKNVMLYLSAVKMADPTGYYALQQSLGSKSACIKFGMALSRVDFARYGITEVDIWSQTFTDRTQMTLEAVTAGCQSPITLITFLP